MEGVTKWDLWDSNACDDLSYYFCHVKPTSVASPGKVEFSKAKEHLNELEMEPSCSRRKTNAKPTSVASARKVDLHQQFSKAKRHLSGLEMEPHSCSTRKIKHSINEERESGIRTEHQRMCSRVKSLADEVKRERKKCKKIGIMNSKLLSDIAEAKLSAKKFMDNLEKEKKARRFLDDQCHELAEEIEGNQAEIGELRNQRERIQEEVEEERKMLQIAGVWREEQAQMKLLDAKLVVEDKLLDINDMISNLEAFLRKANLTTDVDAHQVSQRSETSGVSSVSLKQSRKKESSAFKVKTALSRNRDTTKSESSIITTVSPQRVFDGGGVSVRRNPHVNRAMKGQIEWPRGVRRDELAPKLLEDKLEGQKMLMRNVLKQRS